MPLPLTQIRTHLPLRALLLLPPSSSPHLLRRLPIPLHHLGLLHVSLRCSALQALKEGRLGEAGCLQEAAADLNRGKDSSKRLHSIERG